LVVDTGDPADEPRTESAFKEGSARPLLEPREPAPEPKPEPEPALLLVVAGVLVVGVVVAVGVHAGAA
jgi:hypothetical protein